MTPTLSFRNHLAMGLDAAQLFAVATSHAPDPWQTQLLRSHAPRVLLNCCRQSGKSTATAALALHTAIYKPGSLTLLLSPSLRQSQELYRKIAAGYRNLGRPVAAVAETMTHLELASGSRVISLPENEVTIRGFSAVDLLIVDEAARVDDGTYDAVLPMLAVSRGRLLALSTPWGKMGWWYTAWTDGGTRWERYEVPAPMCPRIDQATLDEAQSRGAWWFGQEYLCQFGEREDSVFSYAQIQAAISSELAPLADDVLPMSRV